MTIKSVETTSFLEGAQIQPKNGKVKAVETIGTIGRKAIKAVEQSGQIDGGANPLNSNQVNPTPGNGDSKAAQVAQKKLKSKDTEGLTISFQAVNGKMYGNDHRDVAGIQELNALYADVRDLIFKQHKIPNTQENKRSFKIHLGPRFATYTDPVTKDEVQVDLLNMKNKVIDDYFAKADEVLKLSQSEQIDYRVGYKGALNGREALQRTGSTELEKLPQDHETARRTLARFISGVPSRDGRIALVERMSFVEVVQSKLGNQIEQVLQQLAQQQPTTAREKKQLEQDIAALKAWKEALQNLDIHALTFALAVYPLGKKPTKKQRDKHIEFLVSTLKTEFNIKEKLQSEREKVRQAAQREQEYIYDLGAMLAKQSSRLDLARYCKTYGVRDLPKESMEDIFMQEAILYAQDPQRYVNKLNKKGLAGSGFFALLPRVSSKVKPLIKQAVDHVVQNEIPQAIPDRTQLPVNMLDQNSLNRDPNRATESAHAEIQTYRTHGHF